MLIGLSDDTMKELRGGKPVVLEDVSTRDAVRVTMERRIDTQGREWEVLEMVIIPAREWDKLQKANDDRQKHI